MREDRDLSREKLAESTGITGNSIYEIERGKQWVSPETLQKFADYFSVSPAAFFTDDVVRIDPTPEEAVETIVRALSLPFVRNPRISRVLSAIADPAVLEDVETLLDSLPAGEQAKPRANRRAR